MSDPHPTLDTAQAIMDGIEHYYPAGFDGFSGADPTPTTYADYLLWCLSDPLTEQQLREGAAAIRIARATPPVLPVSKLTLMRRLSEIGKWSIFKYLISQLPEDTQDAWALAQAVSPDDPLFVQYAPGIKAALELTDEQFDALLE